ncbi:hypothetical protein [Actinocorallia sp. A-T 12471]|uniref:hypothetical protein n=1 Tax=Actinocorallia sp. A-T 12471 TaxID=3089813 RepID=UPI0029D04C9D|nr:hypothetical protein [Actinocorallia sp. A-T 12471]MDX6739307.1 hypothetical protein [Actinocorallia sp. A-T 12471]
MPHWAAWVDQIELQIMAGRCWAELGRELEQATSTAMRAMELATGVASVRPRQRIGSLMYRFEQYAAEGGVSDLLDHAEDWLSRSSFV